MPDEKLIGFSGKTGASTLKGSEGVKQKSHWFPSLSLYGRDLSFRSNFTHRKLQLCRKSIDMNMT